VHPDTICAIFAQENQYKVLKIHHVHKAHMDSYCSRCAAVRSSQRHTLYSDASDDGLRTV
jgi:hypothetical protein